MKERLPLPVKQVPGRLGVTARDREPKRDPSGSEVERFRPQDLGLDAMPRQKLCQPFRLHEWAPGQRYEVLRHAPEPSRSGELDGASPTQTHPMAETIPHRSVFFAGAAEIFGQWVAIFVLSTPDRSLRMER